MSTVPFPQTVLSPVMVGRAAPLEFLTRALERAAVLIAGEAGIGKTRLAAETKTLPPRAGSRFSPPNVLKPNARVHSRRLLNCCARLRRRATC